MKCLHFVLIQHKSAGIKKRFGSQVIALGRGHVRGLPLATKRFIIDATPGPGACTRTRAKERRQAHQTPMKRSRLSTSRGQSSVEELSPGAGPIDGYYSAPKGPHNKVFRCSEISDRWPQSRGVFDQPCDCVFA